MVEKTVRRAGRAWCISQGRCEGSPEPSEVSSLGKLSVFSKPYNLIILNVIHHGFGNAPFPEKELLWKGD